VLARGTLEIGIEVVLGPGDGRGVGRDGFMKPGALALGERCLDRLTYELSRWFAGSGRFAPKAVVEILIEGT